MIGAVIPTRFHPPSLDVLRAQLLGLLNTPAQRVLYVLNGVPTGLLNVLQAKAKA